MDEYLPKWVVCQIGTKVYKYPTCLIQYSDLDEVLNVFDDGEELNQDQFNVFRAVEEDEIFGSTQGGDKLRVSTTFSSTEKMPLESFQGARSSSLRLSSFPLSESKADLFYNIDLSNSMRMDDFSNLNSNIYMSETKNSKLESDLMIDLNLDDVAEDDFDFFGGSGVESKLKPAVTDVFSPFSAGSTPDIHQRNHFSPHTPAYTNNVPVHPSPKNMPSVDTAANDSCPSNEIIPKKVSAELMDSSVEMMPLKWLPFKFQEDILKKYGNEKEFTFTPSTCNSKEPLASITTIVEAEPVNEKKEKIKEYFVAGHPLDVLCDSSYSNDTFTDCKLWESLPDYEAIHLTAKLVEIRNNMHQDLYRSSPSNPDIPTSWTEFVVNLISTRLGGELTQLNLQQYFDLQGMSQDSERSNSSEARVIIFFSFFFFFFFFFLFFFFLSFSFFFSFFLFFL